MSKHPINDDEDADDAIGVKFSRNVLLRVRELTFCNSAGGTQSVRLIINP